MAVVEADRIRIAVLGDFTVTREEKAIGLPASRKTRALLAYLAVTGRPQRRERLCELLWEVPDDPKGALRWSLSKLRFALGAGGQDPLDANRNTVQLTPGLFAVDSAELAEAAAHGFERIATERLEAMARSLRGPFLDDLAMPNCPGFEAWRVAMSDQLDLAARRLLGTLTERLADDPDRVRPYANALRMLGPDETPAAYAAAARSAPETRVAMARPSSSSPGAPLAFDIRYCGGRDGTRLAYAVGGSGAALVRAPHWLSHLNFDAETPIWRHWIEAFHRRFTYLRYDPTASCPRRSSRAT